MGDRVRAEVQLRKALALQKSSLPPAHEDIADTLVALGNVLGANMPETLPYLREALDIRRAVFGDDSREVAQTEYQMIIVGALSLPRAESLPLAQHSVALRRKLFGPDSLEAAESLGALALVYEEERPHRAEAALRDAVAIYRKLAPTDADLGSLHVRLSRTLNTLRRYAEAEAHAREALAVFATIGLGDHLRVLNAKTALMQSLVGQNQLAAAETAANELLAMARRLFPNGAPRLLIAMRQSTQVLSAQQRWDEAAALIQQACDMGKARFSPESQPYAGCLTDVAATRLAQGRAPEAERLYREALPILRRVVGNSSAITAAKEMAFIDTLRKQHKDREAEQLLHERIAVYRLDDAGHQNLRTLLTGLADLENALGRPADAEAHVREALRIGQQVLDAEDSRLVEMKSILGASLAAQGKPPSPR
jgi:tetratricopeptide (TPR) repeat protein